MSRPIQTLQKDGPLPLYYQLKEIIKSQIESGELKPGELIPSERELIELYQISRPTVRQALNELVNSGLLTRERGNGTFVNKPKQSQWYLESLTSFSEEIKKKGLTSKTKVLELKRIEPSMKLKAIFGNGYKEYYHLERLRYVEERPVVVVTTYIPSVLAPDLEKVDLVANSLYSVLRTRYGLKIGYAERTFEALIVGEEDRMLLETAPNAAIQLVQTNAYLQDGNLFEHSISRFRGDLSSFKAMLKYNE